MMREKETNKFRGNSLQNGWFLGMAFVDIPDGCVCKALDLHRTYFNGKQINVEETKNGGKHSAVSFCLYGWYVEKEGFHFSDAKTTQWANNRTKCGDSDLELLIECIHRRVSESEEGEVCVECRKQQFPSWIGVRSESQRCRCYLPKGRYEEDSWFSS